jgi:hypothetical protein
VSGPWNSPPSQQRMTNGRCLGRRHKARYLQDS